MKTELLSEVKQSIKNWWMSLILGIVFVGVAILLMFAPIESYITLSIIFSICMFMCGIFEIVFSISNKNNLSGWGWYLAGGLIDLILGTFLMLYPGMTMVILPFLVAFWIMFRGFASIGFAFDLKSMDTKNWGWYIVFGILAILCSLAIIWRPAVGALSVVYIMAFAFLFIGTFRIMLSFELRSIHKHAQELKKKFENL